MPWFVPPSKGKKVKAKKAKKTNYKKLGLSSSAARKANKIRRRNGRRTD